MKVQTKIILLLTLVVVIFSAGLFGFTHLQSATYERLRDQREKALSRSINSLIKWRGEGLARMVDEFAVSNYVATSLHEHDEAWLRTIIDEPRLEAYQAQAVWVYGLDQQLFFAKNKLYGDVPLPIADLVPLLSRDQTCSFFFRGEHGLLEVNGASVRPASDPTAAPEGYYFTGRIWDNTERDEMGKISNTQMEIVDALAKDERPAGAAALHVTRPLNGWDGRPIAFLKVTQPDESMTGVMQFSRQTFAWLVIFALVLMALLSFTLFRWIREPLRNISVCLKTENLEPIRRLQDDHSEFGNFARLIRRFFEQRDKLIEEINERRQTEAALRESEARLLHSQKMEAIGRLAGGVAHDFNNLLTAIIGYAELLGDRLSSDKPNQQSAAMILKAGRQAGALTRQLLAFSRKQILQPKVFDLNLMVRDMEKLLGRVIGEHIRIETRPEAERSRVKADPGQLEQVIMNLGVNARDAMPRGGTLTILTENHTVAAAAEEEEAAGMQPGDYVVLAVADTGCGMDEKITSRMFEPFFTTKGTGEGTGLGLATVYGIVKQSGGTIRVETAPGAGTTFRLFLPAELGPVESVREIPLPPEAFRHNETVLVVEDEELVRELVCCVLAEKGYQVLCASDGPSALEMIGNHRGPIHLVITDVVMPGMSGQELAERLSAILPDAPILFVSGYSDNDISDQGVLDSGIEYLQKPFAPKALARKVHEVLISGNAPRVSEVANGKIPV